MKCTIEKTAFPNVEKKEVLVQFRLTLTPEEEEDYNLLYDMHSAQIVRGGSWKLDKTKKPRMEEGVLYLYHKLFQGGMANHFLG